MIFFDKYLFITDSALEPNEATFDAVSLFPNSSGSDIRGELQGLKDAPFSKKALPRSKAETNDVVGRNEREQSLHS